MYGINRPPICRMSNGEYWTVTRREDRTSEVFMRHGTYQAARESEFVLQREICEGLVVPTEAELLAFRPCLADPMIRVVFLDREPIVRDLVATRWSVELVEKEASMNNVTYQAAFEWEFRTTQLAGNGSFPQMYRIANEWMRRQLGDVKLDLPVHLLVTRLERDLKARGRSSRRKLGR